MGISKPRPLAKTDKRIEFDCGRESLNRWFHHHAWKNQQTGSSRTNIVCDTDSGKIVGYVSLSSTQIERAFLLKKHQRNMPDPVPAILLGQLAVDKRYQGLGIARSLLFFAFTTAFEVSKHIGCALLITQPLDDEVRKFYRQFGLIDTPFDPNQSMCIRLVDLQVSI